MTIQEAKSFFQGSEFSAETKAKIAHILAGKAKLDPYTTLEIKAVMQEELAKDIAETGIDVSSNPEVAALEKEHNQELEKLEGDMKADAAFVESELAALEKIRKEVMKVSDEMDADAIRGSF